MIRVGVLAGGPSSEHDVSVLSGANVIVALRSLAKEFEAVPVFISKSGTWFFGQSGAWALPTEVFASVDVIFNALHGEYGEDGKVQQLLDYHHVPYTGSEALPSALAMNKDLAEKVLASRGFRVPRSIVLGPTNLDTRSVLALCAPPWIVKPRSRGSSVGVSKVKTRQDLVPAFQKALAYDSSIMVQEFIPGRELTCGVLEEFDGKSLAALVPIEIIPPKEADFFDYQAKYNGKTREVCPAEFYGQMLAHIREIALGAHEALSLRHYSRTDMIIKPPQLTRRAPEIYILEVNTLPGLTNESLFPKAARHAGFEFPELIAHLIRLALRTSGHKTPALSS